MTHLLDDFTEFLTNSPTSWHAAVEMGNRLASCDFIPLDFNEKWELEKGKKYFVIKEGSVAAFALPKKKPKQMAIVAAHTDSPALKLKPNADIQVKNMRKLGVEVYGGPILSSFLARDLAIAGRVVTQKKNGELEEHLVYFEDAPLTIPMIAPHLDREIYKEGLKLNKQDHLPPLATLTKEKGEKSYIEELLKSRFSLSKLVDFDLLLVPIEPPRFLGKDSEMLASYRLDNLASAHAGIVALGNLEKPPEETLPIGFFWDHEEVGSATHVGAESSFAKDLLLRLHAFYKLSAEEEAILRSRSLCLSVDNTHALNPNFENKYDPQNTPLLGEGIVLKYNANMRYSTHARSGSSVSTLCFALKLNIQKFANRTDNPPGSTVGPIFSTQLGIETADIGLAQLSMHAAREMIACQDYIDLCTLLSQFLGGA